MTRTHVAAVPGSLREKSKTRVALRAALAAAEDEGATTDLLDLREMDLPLYDADHTDAGDAPALRKRLRDADAVILGTPVYHHSYASPLKTVLDYCGFEEFEDTLVGVLAVAGGGAGGFPTEALGHLRGAVLGLRAWLYPRQVVIPRAGETVVGGELADPTLADRVKEFGADLARTAGVDEAPDAYPAPI
jgi:NAD(P)H-dependent FMN reductase